MPRSSRDLVLLSASSCDIMSQLALEAATRAAASELGHDLTRDDAAGAVRPDRGCLWAIPGEEYARVLPRDPGTDREAAGLLTQAQRRQMTQLRTEPRRPDDRVGAGERAVRPAHPILLDPGEHPALSEHASLDARSDPAGAWHPGSADDRRQCLPRPGGRILHGDSGDATLDGELRLVAEVDRAASGPGERGRDPLQLQQEPDRARAPADDDDGLAGELLGRQVG